ncbi:MAG: glycoside hydrolase N-terminal domain-containing protein, partial [Lentisphaerota bacterium]
HMGISVDRIHSKTPATSWEWAMLSGNGIHGAMVYGQPSQETIIVNHERLYLPRKYSGDPLEVSGHLQTLRNIIRNEGYAEGLVYLDTRAAEKGLRAATGNPAFHPAFEISISTDTNGNISDYIRETDFRTGGLSVSFKDENASFQRRLFVSRKSNFIFLELSCSKKGYLSCELSLMKPEHPDISSNLKTTVHGSRLTTAYLHDKGGYDGAMRIASTDGQVQIKENKISIKEAQKILLLVCVDPWSSKDDSNVNSLFAKLAKENKSYEAHLSSHVKVHSDLYDRVSIDLGGSHEDRNCDIDTLLESSRTDDKLPPALLEKIYNASRYMSTCCSGSLPPNLQGIWTGTWDSPWGGGYVWDTNLQLAIASVMSCNMKELQESYFSLIEMVVPFWRDNAKRIGGCRGIFASGAFSAGVNADAAEKHTYGHWSWMFGAGYAGWLARIFYDYFLYTGELEFLRKRTVPLLKEIAFFYEDWLFLDERGHYRFSPACSPEIGFADNPTFEIAVVRDVFSMLMNSAKELTHDNLNELEITGEMLSKWKEILEKLPPYMINDESNTSGPVDTRGYYIDKAKVPLAADGALKEFAIPNHQEVYSHRHYSQLYPLFVSYEFDPELTPELWGAAETAFNKRLEHGPFKNGDAGETHRYMHAAMCALRFGRGDVVWNILQMLVKGKFFFPSLMMSHYNNYNV